MSASRFGRGRPLLPGLWRGGRRRPPGGAGSDAEHPREASKAWDLPVSFLDIGPWAPDDRRILGLSLVDDVDAWAHQRMYVLSPDGRLLRTFGGYFQSEWTPNHLAWEDKQSFRVEAYTIGSGSTIDQAALVRCRTDGTCERASAVYPIRYDGSTPYLLGTARTG